MNGGIRPALLKIPFSPSKSDTYMMDFFQMHLWNAAPFFFFFKSKCRWYRATPTCGTQMGSPTDAVTWCLSLLEMKAVAELPIMNLIHCYKGTKHIVGWCRMRWKRRWKAGAERRQKIYLYCKQSGEVSESLPLLYFAYTDTYKYWIWIGR